MRNKWFGRLVSILLAGAMVFNIASVRAYADENAPGKYVKEAFIAYGKTEKEAAEWLTKNGWEPVSGDFNAGKASFFDDNKAQDQNIAAVMGIKRTDKEKEAVTDMAVMNMTGGYSIPDYDSLLKKKKAEIDEFVNSFMPVIKEFRTNHSGKGSSFGQKRADLAYDILNTFYDGDPSGETAVNDTGMQLGELFSQETRQEGNEKGGDLQQIMLESSGAAMLAVESLLVMGADPGEETWLERASGLTGDELAENLVKYAPEAEGQDIAPSAVSQYLGLKYGDTAKVIADQWTDVNEKMLWFENYNEENGLWPQDGESDEDYAARIDKFFEDMKANDEDRYDEECTIYNKYAILYNGLYEMAYEGDWGETLGEFFNPADDAEFAFNSDNFLPLAAGLSEGQTAGLDFLSLETMLLIGLGSEEGLEYIAPDLRDLFGDETAFDVYTGVKREAFRGGAAITSRAQMEEHAGKGDAFDQIWDNTGIVAISTYAAAVVGAVALGAGWYMTANGYVAKFSESHITGLRAVRDSAQRLYEDNRWAAEYADGLLDPKLLKRYETAQANLENAENARRVSGMGYTGRVLLGVGGVLLLGAAVVKAVQMYKYYDRDMMPIPRMIVDESDIVTYLTDDDGNPILDENGDQKKNIDFNTYEYYTAVKCNRPEVGEIGDWQSGVKEYKDHNCYDIADINCDMGQEWLALYTVKSENKGKPILADSLTLKYGKDSSMPKGCTQALHLFTYENAVDLGDTAWAFNNKKDGVRFYWDVDEKAFTGNAASAFTRGQIAFAGGLGLALGILGTTFALYPKRKREKIMASQNETTI